MSSYANYGDYFWEGNIDGCLKNKLNITEPDQLENEERMASARRAAQLVDDPNIIDKTYNFEHLKQIHEHLFQDVYEWAGQPRACDLVRPWKDGKGQSQFVNEEHLNESAEKIFELLNIHDATNKSFTEQLDFMAALLGALNVLHPFREGNGRTTRLFLEHVAEHMNITVNWGKVADTFNETMLQGFLGHKDALVGMLTVCCTQTPKTTLHPKTSMKRPVLSQ